MIALSITAHSLDLVLGGMEGSVNLLALVLVDAPLPHPAFALRSLGLGPGKKVILLQERLLPELVMPKGLPCMAPTRPGWPLGEQPKHTAGLPFTLPPPACTLDGGSSMGQDHSATSHLAVLKCWPSPGPGSQREFKHYQPQTHSSPMPRK